MFAPWKDVTLRFCAHHRRIKAVVVRSRYPVSKLGSSTDVLRDATVFSKTSADSGICTIEIDDTIRD